MVSDENMLMLVVQNSITAPAVFVLKIPIPKTIREDLPKDGHFRAIHTPSVRTFLGMAFFELTPTMKTFLKHAQNPPSGMGRCLDPPPPGRVCFGWVSVY